ncbi:MAG: hypothetical protein JSR46_05250 [Verrucomicrobia bacterium]|nr:hypothetical protein [Verrucomicrobiota bacterium]
MPKRAVPSSALFIINNKLGIYMASLITHIPLAAGVVCGVMASYGSLSGAFAKNALLTSSLGVLRAAQGILIDKPLIEHSVMQHRTALTISKAVYNVNLGFGIGLGIGIIGADPLLLYGILKGSLTQIAGFYAEGFLMVAFGRKVVHFDENDNRASI